MLLIDNHEPPTAITVLSKSVPCQVRALNSEKYADYMWVDVNGREVHVERKTYPELLSGVDKVEDQLRRHLEDKPEARLIFLLEGLAILDAMGTTLLKPTNKNSIWVKSYSSTIRLSQVYSWLYQINQYLEVVQVPDYDGVCTALISMYKSDQKVEHNTFNRHYKGISFSPDYRVIQLMGLMPGLGEVRAKALIDKFCTTYNVVTASPKELQTVDGIGAKLSLDLLRKIGRTDV